ncbi:hypothetical protein CHL76_02460 [Marinococcus halophilus]|uniref:Uncharacterized protein n=1 Tax=Marinococcus halophilus TaxID=1371 RepID=A0A510Y1J3_MARHA|nr:hypothetical protein [Marinococcus halophilus]OZT81238.1 hypothetical protein CHL76_02460 [Marinococcus halophilus]GEK57180.1 hypothetical protein MHA01_00850 [Marinococcus halophilus]
MNVNTLACLQIDRLIAQGKYVQELKNEWLKRWGLPYPYRKGNFGKEIVKYDHGDKITAEDKKFLERVTNE